MNNRSETLQSLYPESMILDLFGKPDPDVQERTVKFYEIWLNSKHLQYWVTSEKIEQARHLLKELGFSSPWDFQCKGTEIRFRRAEDLAQFKLAWAA
jgi:hypothetical protein